MRSWTSPCSFTVSPTLTSFSLCPRRDDCELVVDLTAEMNNAKYNFSRSEKTMLTDFINNIRVLIAGNASLSIEAKIKAVVYQYSQLMMTGSFLKFRLREFSIGASFDFGTFGDLIDASDFGSRFPPTSPPTTSPAPTTAPVQGDCSSAPSLLSIFNGNMTIFYQSSDTYLKNNPGTQATNWRPYLNMCQNQAIMNSTLTVQQKIQKISSIITTYVGTNTARISFVYSITLGSWGTYKQFCTCGGLIGWDQKRLLVMEI
ncbi:hypothetical protein L596_020847 [Steinernema carpocapsae]|uniref:Uncharacterized protein n=1 Tax=Steinernema carpocapsae TaxID=34508 RepID=A0A4U5MUR5_STECR|nr:hypothetical protein L596_020847 [Steinernema carpocapsae]